MKKRSVKIAKALGVSVVKPLVPKGLEVVFNEPLRKVNYSGLNFGGLSPGGVIFPLECLEGFDVDKGIVILADDYGVWQNLDSGRFMFKGDGLRPTFFISKNRVVSIRILPSGRFLYPTS